jgi:hypothetical protein
MFWAMVKVDHRQKKVQVEITKTFGKDSIILKKLVVEPAGRPVDQRQVVTLNPFIVKKGNRLDLDKYYDIIMNAQPMQKILHTLEVP